MIDQFYIICVAFPYLTIIDHHSNTNIGIFRGLVFMKLECLNALEQVHDFVYHTELQSSTFALDIPFPTFKLD